MGNGRVYRPSLINCGQQRCSATVSMAVQSKCNCDQFHANVTAEIKKRIGLYKLDWFAQDINIFIRSAPITQIVGEVVESRKCHALAQILEDTFNSPPIRDFCGNAVAFVVRPCS
ncbi:hypothetical protein Tcan_14206 [Toxocara canis]|uniref:Uncharacterized protein n=1 Tax=Toxocara canis TaxID=6265 RepID=A0A0B2VHA8_TOXCA|nr:hypothetical protein Tcan_14206 [Toxocara canis]